MNPAEATREIFWNISARWLMYLLFAPAMAVAVYGLYRRVRLWRCGRPAQRWDRPLARLGLLFRHALLQGRTFRDPLPGSLHFLIFGGFIVLTAATLVVMADYDFGAGIMRGRFYLYFQSLAVDLFGGLLIVGAAVTWIRRSLKSSPRLVHTREASWILVFVLTIAVTGFVLEGWRIAVTHDPWGKWSPIGFAVARLSAEIWDEASLRAAHAVLWWLHLLLVFGFLAWTPYTKLAHVLTAPLNILTANLEGYAHSLKAINFEAENETLGINDLARFTWKDFLDLDACTECGRCTAECPAHTAGKALSPRDIILELRQAMHTNSQPLLSAPASRKATDIPAKPFIPIIKPEGAVTPEALWTCTTCAACMEACPVYIEQLPKIIDVRRYLVMEEAELPEGMAAALDSLERRGHPFPGTQFSRESWAEGLEIPVIADLEDPASIDVLLWVGCAGALVERNHSVMRSLARLLTRAGVRFAILGREERCTGDPARRIGNEFLFKSMAERNIALLKKYGIQRIVTPCPHCFNALRNEYPKFDGMFHVEHHSAFLARLISEGRLELGGPPDTGGIGAKATEVITFHDPCYLGRYNGYYDEPRQVVRAASKNHMVEMERSRSRSFCCGSGGGMCFVEEPGNQRVNRQRAAQLMASGADVAAVACPFCLTMLEDGLSGLHCERSMGVPMGVMDIAELLWRSCEPNAALAGAPHKTVEQKTKG